MPQSQAQHQDLNRKPAQELEELAWPDDNPVPGPECPYCGLPFDDPEARKKHWSRNELRRGCGVVEIIPEVGISMSTKILTSAT